MSTGWRHSQQLCIYEIAGLLEKVLAAVDVDTQLLSG